MHFLFFFQGGEVIQESITSNVSEDLITLEFQKTDGTLITQIIDFRNVSIENLSIHLETIFHLITNAGVWDIKIDGVPFNTLFVHVLCTNIAHDTIELHIPEKNSL